MVRDGGDGDAVRHKMGAQGKGAGAPPWYGTKHHLIVSEELATGNAGAKAIPAIRERVRL